MSADLTVEVGDDHVAVLEIHRAPNNHFDTELIEAIGDRLHTLAQGAECRAVVLCSEGRHFCAGADLRSAPKDGRGGDLYTEAIRIFEQPLPIVALVQGAAIGGGLGLALAADFRVATPEARFTANFAQLGFHHGFGLTVTLPLAVGSQRAAELLYTGRNVAAEEALSIGLCDRLVGTEELREAGRAFARELAAAAPLAVRSIRATLRDGLADAVRAATAHEMREQQRLMQTTDFREGVRAARERRPAEFTGS